MFSGFLLFGHNHDFDFLNKIYFSGTLCATPLDFQIFLRTCAVDFLEINFEYSVSTIILRCQ